MSQSKQNHHFDDTVDVQSTETKNKKMALSQSAYHRRDNSLNLSRDDNQDPVLKEMAKINYK